MDVIVRGMNETLRELERAHAESPDDQLALERLQDERVRRGLGWHGEEIDEQILVCGGKGGERGVYSFLAPAKHDGPITDIQLVYVPGGEVACPRCEGGRRAYGTPDEIREGRASCIDCRMTPGKRPIGPFYAGRFPVTRKEYSAFVEARQSITARVAWSDDIVPSVMAAFGGGEHDPITNVSLSDAKAKAFCSWAGLRLASEQEWRWAALGAGEKVPCCMCSGWPSGFKAQIQEECYACAGSGRCKGPGLCPYGNHEKTRPRLYPWGNEPPSPERCHSGAAWHANVVAQWNGDTAPSSSLSESAATMLPDPRRVPRLGLR